MITLADGVNIWLGQVLVGAAVIAIVAAAMALFYGIGRLYIWWKYREK